MRDEDWFTSLYATHHPDIARCGLRRLGELEASVELAQEVFVVAWRRCHQVPDHGLEPPAVDVALDGAQRPAVLATRARRHIRPGDGSGPSKGRTRPRDLASLA